MPVWYNEVMDKKTKIFFLIFFLLIIGSVAATYWRIMIKKDYIVESQIDCDPYVENCFVWECDPQSSEEGEACTGDPEEDIWYYKIARRSASRIPLCDPNAKEDLSADEVLCDPWTCEVGEPDCEETLCDEETAVEQEAECNDPEQYALENPIEEESIECEEGDEECLAEAESEEEVECEEGDEECLATEEETTEEKSGDISKKTADSIEE